MDKRREDVLKLVNAINKNADDRFKDSILGYSESFFNSLLGVGPSEEPSIWKNKIMAKVLTMKSRSNNPMTRVVFYSAKKHALDCSPVQLLQRKVKF